MSRPGQHRQIKVRGQLLDQNVMHKEHRVGYFGKLCAHRAGPRAVQQRSRQRQQDKHPGTGQAQVILPSQGCVSTAPASSSGARIYLASGERQKRHAEQKFRDMHGHQPRIPAQQVHRDADRQRQRPRSATAFCAAPLQKREQQV